MRMPESKTMKDGFSPKKKSMMCDYLFIYETYIKAPSRTQDSNKKLFARFPACRKVNLIIKDIKFRNLLKDKNQTKDECNFMACSKNNSRLIEFTRHLRNSIAHGFLGTDGQYIKIIDYKDKDKDTKSAYGKLEKKKFNEILSLLSQEQENNSQI